MDHQLAQEVIACVPYERHVFHYYRDRYSLGLLGHVSKAAQQQTGQGVSIAQLRQSSYGSLLQKPRVKTVMATMGKGLLTEADWFVHDYDAQQEAFVLTLSTWGWSSNKEDRRRRWQQTSRPGCNLVLQMNFSNLHDEMYSKLKVDEGETPFSWGSHPISDKRHTLAWSRIDIDFASNTALIEEVQNDWLRDVMNLKASVERRLKRGVSPNKVVNYYGIRCSLKTAQEYCNFTLGRYAAMWDEAMLWASIEFLKNEIGIGQIFYHSVDSGRLLKRIDGNLPPRSLYTDLPRRFCFASTQEAPEFLLQNTRFHRVKKAYKKELSFFKLPELNIGLS